jgi:hypothetical protein
MNAENYLPHEERIPTELQPKAVVSVRYMIYRQTYSDVPRIGMIVRPYCSHPRATWCIVHRLRFTTWVNFKVLANCTRTLSLKAVVFSPKSPDWRDMFLFPERSRLPLRSTHHLFWEVK